MTRSPAFERYTRDGALVLGGGAAILLQIADPVVGRGVAAHSAFADDPMRRLRHTLGYVYAIGLGDPEQVRRAAGFVNRAHAGVPGATDPDRQLWVAAILYRVGVDTSELLHGTLDDALADDIYAASELLGTALQVPPGRWPADRVAFERYWRDAVAALEVGDDARSVARDLLHPRNVPFWVRAGMPLGRTLTAGLLPARIRDAYGLPHDPARFARSVRIARATSRITPRRLRELPSRRIFASP
ncbi:MAG: oxygenase MpaB family protein [Microbacteriaceae bacterium]